MGLKKLILLVDDDRDIARGVALRLGASGYEVLVAHDGARGLESARDRHPDAIVLDMRMPVMDGMQVLAGLREREETRSIPVVVLSASVLARGKARTLECGARYFLQKPFDPRQLLDALQAVTQTQRISA